MIKKLDIINHFYHVALHKLSTNKNIHVYMYIHLCIHIVLYKKLTSILKKYANSDRNNKVIIIVLTSVTRRKKDGKKVVKPFSVTYS